MRSWRRHRVPFIEQGEHSECGLAARSDDLAAFRASVTMDERAADTALHAAD